MPPARPSDPAAPALPTLPLRSATLSPRKPTRFDFAPDAPARAAIAAALDLLGLPALRLKGEITPQGRNDVQLRADLRAEVIQPCGITLAPVPSTLAEVVERLYLKDFAEPQAEETELPDGLDAEPLPETIDIAAVAIEALSLALPPFPRAPGAELGPVEVAEPGVAPLGDAVLKPFAGLAGLAARLREAPPEDEGSQGG